MKTITIEQLAEKLKGKLWEKGDLKRIYLDRGHNTKKMSTKTYVFEKDGEFQVSCYIECPSQPYQWIKSQQQEIIDSVNQDIETIIELFNTELIEAKLTDDKKEVLVNVSYNGEPAKWYTENEFYARFNEYPENVYDSLPKVELAPLASPIERKQEVQESDNTIKINPTPLEECVNGSKVKHEKFGIGTVINDNPDVIEVDFPEVGVKKMLKKYVKLEKVEHEPAN